MRALKAYIVAIAIVVTGLVGIASADLCPKCRKMMFTCDIGRCKECGGDTPSGGYQLCKTCGEKAGVCQACKASLKQDRPAGQDAKDTKDKGQPPAVEPTREHKLPDDPKATVIMYRTGAHILGRMLPSSGPDLQILADGTVIAHDPYGRPPDEDRVMRAERLPLPNGAPAKVEEAPKPVKPAHVASVKGSIKAGELQDLLRFIIDDSRFPEFDQRAAMDKYNASGAPRIADAATTTFEVTADGRTHKASIYAVDCGTYNRFPVPPIPELARMQAVYSRLSALRQKIINAAKSAKGSENH